MFNSTPYTHKYLYLSSYNSTEFFPRNNHNDFTVKMLNTSIFHNIRLCGLISFQFHDQFTINKVADMEYTSLNLYVCSDLCQQSFVNDCMLPVLTRLNINVNNDSALKDIMISHPIYIPIVQSYKESVRIYIVGDDGKDISISKGPTKATLHLK